MSCYTWRVLHTKWCELKCIKWNISGVSGVRGARVMTSQHQAQLHSQSLDCTRARAASLASARITTQQAWVLHCSHIVCPLAESLVLNNKLLLCLDYNFVFQFVNLDYTTMLESHPVGHSHSAAWPCSQNFHAHYRQQWATVSHHFNS